MTKLEICTQIHKISLFYTLHITLIIFNTLHNTLLTINSILTFYSILQNILPYLIPLNIWLKHKLMLIFPATVIVSENNFHWKNGPEKLLDNVRSYLHMEAWSSKMSVECELLSYLLVETKCSRCCTILTSPMTLLCLFTRIVHQAGLTLLITRSSTTVWSPLAQQRATQACGKYLWWCGKTWTEDVARWEMPVPILQMPMAFTRWSWRTLKDITPPTERLLDSFTTQPGSLSHITKKVSSLS